ncbi:SIS domain-containing protein [Leucobacter sp. gxy201]|uniref:MurR/RpiR family transcriptional regulator n=1 Tax=Leucobacter sp. gxy201 TaxID=2957200 RepID=UPI003DA15D44
MNSDASPPLGGTRALIQSHLPSLVPSERRVAEACIDDPVAVARMSVADLAGRADVSPATVVRACQRMGFGGFQRLKELLIRDQASPPASLAPGGEAAVDTGHPVEQVFSSAIDGIHGALGALDFSAFDAAALSIRDCGRLLVVGNGASLAPAQSVALHFLTSGRVCEAPVDIVAQHIAAKLLKPGDVCLAVSDSGMNHFTLRSAQLSAEAGATVIGVTSYGGSELAQVADHALVAGAGFHNWNSSHVAGNIVQMLLLSALHAASLGGLPDTITAQRASIAEAKTMVVPAED